MDDVAPDQQRDTETALLDSDTLQLVDDIDVNDVDDRTDLARSQSLAKLHGRVDALRMHLAHLANLLGQRHLAEQRGGAISCGSLLQ